MVCIFSKLAGVRDEGFHTSRMILNTICGFLKAVINSMQVI
jgi:hypothetical protein